jgi:cell shape-determining protein MreC
MAYSYRKYEDLLSDGVGALQRECHNLTAQKVELKRQIENLQNELNEALELAKTRLARIQQLEAENTRLKSGLSGDARLSFR